MDEIRPGTMSRRTLLRRAIVGAAGIGALSVVGCDSGSSTSATASRTVASSPGPEKTLVAPTAPPKAEWSVVPGGSSAPSPRRDHTTVVDPSTSLTYLFGGRSAGASMNDLWVFDPTNATWREIAVAGPKPAPRFAPVAVYDRPRKRLVVATGQGNGEAFFNDVWAFDLASATWSELGAANADRPEIRYGSGGAYDEAGNRMFVSHGFTDRGRFDDTWYFDLVAEGWTKIATAGALPIKRCLTRCLWLPKAKALLMYGGQTDNTPFLGDLWSLDMATGRWYEKTLSPSPGPRNLHGAAAGPAGERWYMFGGNTPAGPVGDTWVYDVGAETCTQIQVDTAPPPRYSVAATVANGRLYVIGGNDGKTDLGDHWSLPLGI